jgi:hypothetical protein
MSDRQAIADRAGIEALRGEFTDPVMMNDHDRLASLFTHDGVLRIPEGDIEAVGREEIRALGERRQALTDYFVQTTYLGTMHAERPVRQARNDHSDPQAAVHGRQVVGRPTTERNVPGGRFLACCHAESGAPARVMMPSIAAPLCVVAAAG